MQPPKPQTARRMAGRVLRAHRAGVIILEPKDVQVCVEGLTEGMLGNHTRRRLGELWLQHGMAILNSGTEQGRRHAYDDELDELARWAPR